MPPRPAASSARLLCDPTRTAASATVLQSAATAAWPPVPGRDDRDKGERRGVHGEDGARGEAADAEVGLRSAQLLDWAGEASLVTRRPVERSEADERGRGGDRDDARDAGAGILALDEQALERRVDPEPVHEREQE